MFQKLDVEKLPNPILIVSPHPDDDISSSGGLIQRARPQTRLFFLCFPETATLKIVSNPNPIAV